MRKSINLVSDLGSELALAVLVEKRKSAKMNSAEILPLIRRINESLAETALPDYVNCLSESAAGKNVNDSRH
jgi:hypothetical protein